MRKQKGFTLIELVLFLFVVVGVGSWVWNVVKFASCDFESNFKCEVVHGAGVFVPPLSIVTVWFSDDSSNQGEKQ